MLLQFQAVSDVNMEDSVTFRDWNKKKKKVLLMRYNHTSGGYNESDGAVLHAQV